MMDSTNRFGHRVRGLVCINLYVWHLLQAEGAEVKECVRTYFDAGMVLADRGFLSV